jgi:hypothetical protein
MRLERSLGSLPTAFNATAGSGSPKQADLCEYNDLPGYGYTCGHNVVSAAGVGAAITLAVVIDPRWILADIDAMMLIYPGMYNVAHSRAVGTVMGSSSSSAGLPTRLLVPNSASTRLTGCSRRALDAEDWPAVGRIYIEGIATLLHGKSIWW